MKCLNCGAENINGSTFCIKCGTNLKETQSINNMNATPFNEQPAQTQYTEPQNQSVQPVQTQYTEPQNQSVQQPMNNQQSFKSNGNSAPLNYLMYIIAILLKPIKCFREEETKLNDSKTSFILALIITLAMTVFNMIKTIFTTVRVASYSWKGGYTYSWQWDNLKNIKWLELIGKNFLIYACIILAITLVFYLGSLIVKKQLSFIKSLAIATTSIIPAVVGIMILSPLGGLIWSPLSIVFMVAGAVYTLVILYELMNSELKLEGDVKIYFNLACLGILAVAGYYAYMKLFMSSIPGGLENILDVFK